MYFRYLNALCDFSLECMDVNFFSNVHLLGYKMILLMYRRSSLYVFIYWNRFFKIGNLFDYVKNISYINKKLFYSMCRTNLREPNRCYVKYILFWTIINRMIFLFYGILSVQIKAFNTPYPLILFECRYRVL